MGRAGAFFPQNRDGEAPLLTTLRLPRILTETIGVSSTHDVEGATVRETLESLFTAEPGLRNHILDESARIRPHVSVFVDGVQADLGTSLAPTSEVRVLHAVSGG